MAKPIHPERRPVVIAGASSGIGAATATLFAGAGYPVALGARRQDRVEELAAAIREAGGEAVAHRLDVSDDASVVDFADKARADLGDIEVVVCAAALNRPGQVWDVSPSDALEVMNTNVVGPYRLINAFVPGMVERRRGDLVFVTSDVVQTLRPRTSTYNASKWAVDGLVQTMQRELEGTGVRASLVRPGPVHTEMGFDWPEGETVAILETWVKWGLARHSHFLNAEAIAEAVHTIVTAPRGTHIAAMDVQPEAPVEV
jgi:NADP-dependent 3-hydroxy acid dehydrogenase YdfG